VDSVSCTDDVLDIGVILLSSLDVILSILSGPALLWAVRGVGCTNSISRVSPYSTEGVFALVFTSDVAIGVCGVDGTVGGSIALPQLGTTSGVASYLFGQGLS
jgi:hypothetical protein